MKKIFVSLFFLFSLFVVKPIFAGNDITITCNSGSDCIKSSELPLFSETNIYPGFTQSQTFSVDNNRNGPCQLKFKAISTSHVPDILSQKILINISGINNDYNLVNYSLNDLLNPDKPIVSLGSVDKGVKNNYLWSVVFDEKATNEYQNQISNFSINFNFECDDEAGDVLSSISDNPSSNQGTARCTNSAPNAPTRLIATRESNGDVSLTWTHTTSDHSGYLIAFGNSPGDYKYGSPDVGNVTGYTVQGLTYGAQYCFYVRSLNGCMPGERTPEYCVNPGSTIVPLETTPPTDFEPEILGVNTEEENQSTEQLTGGILGSSDKTCNRHWLPILFIAALLINLIYIRFSKRYILFPFLISLIAFIIDKYILNSRCCLGPNWLCSYFWIGNILSFLVPLFLKLKIKKSI